MSFPVPVSVRLSLAQRADLTTACAQFGATDGEIIRRALEHFLPAYLAGQGNPEHAALLSEVAAALEANPSLKVELAELLRSCLREIG